MKPKILLVDDDKELCELLALQLGNKGFDVAYRLSAIEGLEEASSGVYESVVTDISMPGMSGIELSQKLAERLPELPVIVITSFGSMDTAVSALRVGAYDFITKPFDAEVLAITLNRAIGHRRLKAEVKVLREAVSETESFDEMIGASPQMRQVYSLVERASETDSSVLITGESGTGKELVARALHRKSQRSEQPFVPINCAAMPEPLLESELFGHVKGAFTSAVTNRTGLFVEADKGTLFLDEIGDMPIGLQAKILRALEDKTVRPIGSNKEIPFNTRMIAATNTDLAQAIEDRRFRQDLYYRINVVHIKVPPLRDRGQDVLLLANSFLEKYALQNQKSIEGFSEKAAEKLLTYYWPGNVRELKNAIEHAVALTRYSLISPDDLPEGVRQYKSSHVIVSSKDPSQLISLDDMERQYILRVLDSVGGNNLSLQRFSDSTARLFIGSWSATGSIQPSRADLLGVQFIEVTIQER